MGPAPEYAEYWRANVIHPGRGSLVGRAALARQTVHIVDVLADPEFEQHEAQRAGGYRSVLAVPMLREDELVGLFFMWRTQVRAFTDKQIDLVTTFADQAVIAIENVRLFTELQEKNRALTEAHAQVTETLEQQTATSEILRVISSSPTDVRPVFDVIARNARRLCEADSGSVFIYDGELLHLETLDNVSAQGADALRRAYPMPASHGHATGRAILSGRPVHIADARADPNYDLGGLLGAGLRSVLAVPLMHDGTAVGCIIVHTWATPRPFSSKQIGLLQTFADQAIIAIQNARLFKELQERNRDLTEALDQQTATSEVLKVISRSAFDLQPVLETVVESATRLCGAVRGHIFRLDGGILRFAAAYGARPGFVEYLEQNPVVPGAGSVAGRVAAERRPIHVHDVRAEADYEYGGLLDQQEYRTVLAVPMLRDDTLLGVIVILKSRVDPFTDKQIELVTTFADQAVIAIENVRLFTELETRNSDLTETLEQQTATSEILRVISSSPTDVQPVFDTIAQSVVRLCDGLHAAVFRFDGELVHLAAHHNIAPEALTEFERSFPARPSRQIVSARAILDHAVVHVPNIESDPEASTTRRLGLATGYRSALSVPMLREGLPIGAISVGRAQVGPFSDRQIELVKTFADQAVIAIENVRLFKELENRNRELTQTLEQQTATGEILRIISSSPTDVQPVFEAVAESAARLCEVSDVTIFRRDEDGLRLVAHHGPIPVQTTLPLVRGTSNGRAVLDGRTIHIADMQAESEEFPEGSANARLMGHRTILCVPLMREGIALGTIHLRRTEARLFTERQVALLQTFADQAVIAIENVRLFQELEARNRDLTETLEQQTATSEILRVISSSPTDTQPVFETIAENAARLCGGVMGGVFHYDGERMHLGAMVNFAPGGEDTWRRLFPRPPSRDTAAGRAILERAVVILSDWEADSARAGWAREVAQSGGYRSAMAVPMLREGVPIGVILVCRVEPGSFPDAHVQLLKTFAEQAVIAIQNVRLFTELQQKNQALTQAHAQVTEALEQQTATGEILRVISSSPTDAQPVFDAIARSAARLCEAQFCLVFRFDGELLHFAAHDGLPQAGSEAVRLDVSEGGQRRDGRRALDPHARRCAHSGRSCRSGTMS